MRLVILGGMLLGLASVARAGELPQQPPVTLTLSVEATMLIVETMKQIGCQTVGQMATCDLARDTLKSIQQQVIAQQPK